MSLKNSNDAILMIELAFWRVEYTENGFVCQAIKSTKHQDMQKGFSPILQISITEWNVVSWEKSVSR